MIKQLVVLFFVFLFSSADLDAQVKGTIVGPGSEKYPIAVSPLKNLGSAKDGGKISQGVADAITRDLALSGWFRVLDRSAYIEDAQKTGFALGTFDFKDWSTLGAEGLVKGSLELQGEDLIVELRLFDVYRAREIIGKKYTGKAGDFRRMAHKFADEIIFQFTGERGVFDSRIAYVSTGGGRFKDIYVAHLDGNERSQVTNNRSINLSPSWNRDGRSVLYTSYQDGSPGLYLFDLFAGKEIKVSRTGHSLGGKWSPDGHTVAVTLERDGNTDLYLLDQTGKVLRRLTHDPGIDVSPAWSPDGNRLVFVSNRGGSPQIYVMELSNGSVRRLTYTGSYNTSPDWSPKGDKIVYTGRSDGRFNIFTVRVEDGKSQQLTSKSGDSEEPSWSPDGRFLLFTSNRQGGRYRLYLMQATGENQQRLTGSGGDDTNPSWSPRLD
jgi:TolB protein